MATQNPIEQEGTYPLPEAQMDRFSVQGSESIIPEAAAEQAIVRMLQARGGRCHQRCTAERPLRSDAIFAARAEIQAMPVSDACRAVSRGSGDGDPSPQKESPNNWQAWIAVGSSPRASIALHRAARAEAWLQGRDHVLPEDVRAVAPAVMRHRLILSYDALADGIDSDRVVREIMELVAVG